LRPAVAAIYAFARTADDLADEGDASAEQRLAMLAELRTDLAAVATDKPPSPRWCQVMAPLGQVMHHFGLPEPLLAALLSAFVQDVEKTRADSGYADRAELLDYCSRSANPVGRLLLHLYGVSDAHALAQSDAVCSALQLINFWQDPSVDLPRGRLYFPLADCAAFGVAPAALRQAAAAAVQPTPNMLALVQHEVAWARALVRQGAPLVHRLPGRIGWELRLVVQGGLRILDKIEALGFDSLRHRPTLHAFDAPLLCWRALRMPSPP
jgi:squalene synthase HpnC